MMIDDSSQLLSQEFDGALATAHGGRGREVQEVGRGRHKRRGEGGGIQLFHQN